MMQTHQAPLHIYEPKRWKDAILTKHPDVDWSSLFALIDNAYNESKVYPRKEDVFKALEIVSPQDVKVVIVGQDPYHGPGQAHGLSFSVPPGVKIPPSLRNMFKELNRSFNCPIPDHGNLMSWAEQGVLLLNTSLTVEAGRAGSHAKMGWHEYTNAVLDCLQNVEHIVYLLWGNHAEAKRALIHSESNLILSAPHPSPLSAHKGFIGCDHFVAANAYLQQSGRKPINWCLPSQPDLFSKI